MTGLDTNFANYRELLKVISMFTWRLMYLFTFYLAHRVFRQRGDCQGWVDAGIGGHDGAVDDIETRIIMHFKVFVYHPSLRILSNRRATQDVGGCGQAKQIFAEGTQCNAVRPFGEVACQFM